MLKLLLIRHGESVGNAEGRMMGQRDDPLTPLGQAQARRLAAALAEAGLAHIYVSPLQRAAETAAALPPLPPLTLTYLDDLKEFQNGVFAGLTWNDAKARYPALCQRLVSSSDWIAIPEAETLQDGRDRAERVVRQLLTHHNGERIAVISHQWILQQIVAVLLGCDRTWGIPWRHTGIVELRLDRDRWAQADQALNSALWQIQRFNDVSHLD